MRARFGTFFQEKSRYELIGSVGVRSDGHRVRSLCELPREPQPVEALLEGVNGELWVSIGAYIEVELKVVVVRRVGLALER